MYTPTGIRSDSLQAVRLKLLHRKSNSRPLHEHLSESPHQSDRARDRARGHDQQNSPDNQARRDAPRERGRNLERSRERYSPAPRESGHLRGIKNGARHKMMKETTGGRIADVVHIFHHARPSNCHDRRGVMSAAAGRQQENSVTNKNNENTSSKAGPSNGAKSNKTSSQKSKLTQVEMNELICRYVIVIRSPFPPLPRAHALYSLGQTRIPNPIYEPAHLPVSSLSIEPTSPQPSPTVSTPPTRLTTHLHRPSPPTPAPKPLILPPPP